MSQIVILSFLLFVNFCHCLDNGLARKPPMGWMSWTLFLCETDCARHPFSCISEQLYKDMADRMVDDGYLAAGYEFVHIDDCWMEKKRDSSKRLVADQKRFNSGIRALSDYMHAKGLKLGIYEDFGNFTCQNYPGSLGHLDIDAETFAEWDVDYLKLDGCYSTPDQMATGYPEMGFHLNKSGRPIVYSCSWPAYLIDKPELVDYHIIAKHCNLWRNFDDISLSWDSIFSIIKYYNKNQDKLREGQKIGAWNDPDMIIVGNPEITEDQAKAQMTIWSIWSAPLIMSNDLRTVTPEHKAILLNERVIAIDQDPLGIMGRLVFQDETVYVYVKEVTPVDDSKNLYSYAFAVLNHGHETTSFSTDLSSIGLHNKGGYDLQDLWTGEKLGRFQITDVYKAKLPPTSVVFVKATLPDK